MKIVINRCYGGFGLSYKAKLALLELGCEHTKLVSPDEYYGKYSSSYKDDLESFKANNTFYIQFVKDQPIVDKHDYSETRACKHLVDVVETLGTEASGLLSKLSIVTIPDGIDWEIDEYDGMESVEELHRSWG